MNSFNTFSAFFAILLLLLLPLRTREASNIPFKNEDLVVMVTNSNYRRSHAEAELEQRRRTCASAARKLGRKKLGELTLEELEGNHSPTEKERELSLSLSFFLSLSLSLSAAEKEGLEPVEYSRARHVVTEIQRTTDAVLALRNGDYQRFGQLMTDSHKSLR